MSQFCGNCGTKIPENATFCPNCGTQTVQSTNVQTQEAPQSFGYGARPATRPKNKSVGLIAGIGAAVLVVIIVVVVLLAGGGGGGGGYKGAIDKFFSAMESKNMNRVIDCLPPQLREDYEYYLGYDMDNQLKSIKSIKYKIAYAERMDKADIEYLEDIYSHYAKINIEDAYEVRGDVKVKIDLSKLDSNMREYYDYIGDEIDESFRITVLKTKGRWYVLSMY